MSQTAGQISPVSGPCFVTNYSITKALKFKCFGAADIVQNQHFHPFWLEASLEGRKLGNFKLSVYFALMEH